MKILSFDIGIKNLAFAILNYDKETKNINISDWNIINILQDECDKFNKICDMECKFKSKYHCMRNETPVVFCEKHKKKEIERYEEIMSIPWNKNIHKDTCSNENCNTVSKWECNSFFYCTKHKNELKKEIKNSYCIKKIKTIKIANVSAKYIFEKTIQIFDKQFPHFLECDYVVLESQPPFGSIKLKTVLNNLQSYFLIKGKYSDSPIKDVCTISANLKLKYDEEKTTEEVKNKSGKDRYNKNKLLAIEYTIKILKEQCDFKNIEHFMKYKKQDDLADAFLQGISFINKNHNLLMLNK